MRPTGMFTIREVADASGMPVRQVRHMVDMGRLPYSQWDFYSERYLGREALARLEAFGIRVDRSKLPTATAAHAADSTSSTQDSENES